MTHHHFDHVLGGGAFGGVPRYAAPPVAVALSSGLPDLCAEAVRYGADPAEVERPPVPRAPDRLTWSAGIDTGWPPHPHRASRPRAHRRP